MGEVDQNKRRELTIAGNRIARQIRSNIRRMSMTASGKTENSIRVEATDKQLVIWGAMHIFSLEHGRGPTRRGSKGSGVGSLRKRLREWILDKGIQPDGEISIDTLAFIMARKIHKEGTRLFRSGRPSGVLSKPDQTKLLKDLAERIAKLETTLVVSDILKELEKI